MTVKCQQTKNSQIFNQKLINYELYYSCMYNLYNIVSLNLISLINTSISYLEKPVTN